MILRPLLLILGMWAMATASALAQPPDKGKTAQASWVLSKVEGKNLYYKTFKSKAAGGDVSYLIYLPPEYEKSTDKKYPVVYWLHGVGGSQAGVPGMAERFTTAIAAGKCPPMFVVYVNGMKDSMWCDSKDGKTPVETVLVKDLIPHIDATYRTLATREGRMIEGFSMGGFGAARLGFKHHDQFGSVSMLAGALHKESTLKDRRGSIFEKVFGGDAEYFKSGSPWTLAEKNAAAVKEKTLVRQVVGDKDPTLAYNRDYDAHLTKLGITHIYTVLPGVGHSPGPIYDRLGDKNWEFYGKAFAKARGEVKP